MIRRDEKTVLLLGSSIPEDAMETVRILREAKDAFYGKPWPTHRSLGSRTKRSHKKASER